MAKKPAAKKAEVNEALNKRVAILISRGNMRQAAEEMKASQLSEAQFDALMAKHPGLREVYLSL